MVSAPELIARTTLEACSPLPPAAAMYAEAFGWPVTVQASEVVVECGDVVDVIAMPIGLAGEVNHLLKLHRLATPVMEVVGKAPTWAFFSEPRQLPHGEQVLKTLSLHRVVTFGHGERVPLPPGPTQGNAVLRWVVPPLLAARGPLAPWAALVSCALTAIRR